MIDATVYPLEIDGAHDTEVVSAPVGPYLTASVQAVATPDGWNSAVLEAVRSNDGENWALLQGTTVELSADGITDAIDCAGFAHLGVRVKTAAGSTSRIKITLCAKAGAFGA
jgi:hypothetical protein